MKTIIYFFLFFSYVSVAQPKLSTYPDFPITKLNNIQVQDNFIYTSGGCQVAMLSSDNGKTWDFINTEKYIRGLKIIPKSMGTKALYLTNFKVLELSINDLSFKELNDPIFATSKGKFRFLLSDKNYIYLISDKAIFTFDYLQNNWEKLIDLNLSNHFITAANKSLNNIFLGTNNGEFIKINLKDNSITKNTEFSSRINSISFANDTLGYVAASNSNGLKKTINGGQSFFSLLKMPEAINPVAISDEIVITVNTNRLYLSMDGGKTSKRIPIPKDGYTNLINGVYLSADNTLYFVGKSGMIMKSIDFGQTFEHINLFLREDLFGIKINEKGEGYALGGTQTIIHTNDGGKTWAPSKLDFSEKNTTLYSVEYLNDDKFIIGHENGFEIVKNEIIINSIDGSSERILKSNIGNFLISSRYDGNYSLYKSSDDGVNWELKYSSPNYISDIQQSSTGKLYIPGEAGFMVTSIDQGETWVNEKLGGIDSKVQKLKFSDDNFGLISVGNILYLTTDGGKTNKIIKSGYAIENLYIFSELHFSFTYGSDQATNIQETTDQGKTWTKTGYFCARSRSSYYDGDKTIFYAHYGGHINKHAILNISKIDKINDNIEWIVYPNPVFQGQYLNINKNIKTNEITIVNIMTGKIVFEKYNYKQNKIDTKFFPKGMYFIKIKSENKTTYNKFLIN